MTGPRCHEKKHVTATIEYSSPTGLWPLSCRFSPRTAAKASRAGDGPAALPLAQIVTARVPCPARCRSEDRSQGDRGACPLH
jgi:hypothetical protein